jgi:DNA-binding transcriptional LysR family regulator
MFSLYQLQIFQVVAEEGSISRAAERLYLTQPAVSQHIGALEKDLGTRLFERGPRGVNLTASGEVLGSYARCLLQLADEAHRAVARAGDVKDEQLRIGASPGAGVYLLPEWVHAFHKRHPSLSVTLTTAITPAVLQAILDGNIDIGIVEGEPGSDAVAALPLWDEAIAIVVGRGHPLWGKTSVDAATLSAQGFVVREEGSLTRAWESHILGEYDITPQIVASFDSPVAIKQAVIAGLGIALLPEFSIRQELTAGTLHAVKLAEGFLVRTLRLIWRADSRENPAVQAFMVHLADEFPQIALQLSHTAEPFSLLPRLQEQIGDETAGPAVTACDS